MKLNSSKKVEYVSGIVSPVCNGINPKYMYLGVECIYGYYRATSSTLASKGNTIGLGCILLHVTLKETKRQQSDQMGQNIQN